MLNVDNLPSTRAISAPHSLKPSVYTFDVAFEGRHYLYNTLSQSIIRIGDPLDNILRSDTPARHRLSELGFIVDFGVSPEEEYSRFFSAISLPKRHLSLLFTANTTCNLACSYCFENRVRRSAMSDETFDATVAWMRATIVARHIERVSINLFGGEPLLEVPRQLQLLSALRSMQVELGFGVTSVQLTTNGLSPKVKDLDDLVAAGVLEAQITIDGNRQVNDRRRLRRGVKLTDSETTSVYNEVLDSLPAFTSRFLTTLKINFDRDTISSAATAVAEVVQGVGANTRNLRIKPEPIAIWKRSRSSAEARLFSRDSSELASAFSHLIDLALSYNIDLDLSAVFPTPCMLTSEDSYLLEPNGKLRSCISAFDLDVFDAGSVFDQSGAAYSRSSFRTSFASAGITDCLSRECGYLPVCDGGCKYEGYLSTGSVHKMQCGFDYFEAVVPHVVKAHHYRAYRIEEVSLPI